jgi:hypothetical protein
MSRRQTERGSRFQVEIEDRVRLAAVEFRDNDVEEPRRKPRYIAPYVKGPQDKPLKPPASQLFVVRR